MSREAVGYGLAMLHEAGVADEWFSAYSERHQTYLLHFYRSGHRAIAGKPFQQQNGGSDRGANPRLHDRHRSNQLNVLSSLPTSFLSVAVFWP
jgi:hypothetical protein